MYRYTLTIPRSGAQEIVCQHTNRAEARMQMLCVALGMLTAGSSVRVTCDVNGTWVYNNNGDCAARIVAEIARLNKIGE